MLNEHHDAVGAGCSRGSSTVEEVQQWRAAGGGGLGRGTEEMAAARRERHTAMERSLDEIPMLLPAGWPPDGASCLGAAWRAPVVLLLALHWFTRSL